MNSRKLNDFLKNHKKKENEEFTHTRIGGKENGKDIYGGVYVIKGDDLKQFHELYVNAVIKEGSKEYLTEKPLKESLFNFDFDFRYDTSITTRQHNQEHIDDLVKGIIDGIDKICLETPPKYEIAVLEKKDVIKEETKTKDGIHILVSLRANSNEKLALRDNLIEYLEENKTFENLPLTNSLFDIVDKVVLTESQPWIMPFSQKPNNIPYNITNIFEVIDQENGKIFKELHLEDFTNEELFYKWTIHNTKPHIIKTGIEYNPKKKQNEKPRKEQPKNSVSIIPLYLEEISDLIPVSIIDECARKLCCAFKSVDAKDICYKILKKSSYVKENYDEWFNDFYKNNWVRKVSLRTIHYYARQHNQEEYYKIMAKYKLIDINDVCKNCADKDFADQAIKIFGDDFKVINENKATIYYYDGVRWVLDNNKTNLKQRLFLLLPQYYYAILDECQLKLTDEISDESKTLLEKQIDAILKNIMKLKKNACVNAIAEVFTTLKTTTKNIEWEQNPYLFVFEDRIMDLRTQKWVSGDPNDNMKLYCGYKWVEPTEEDMTTIKDVIEKIHPIKEERDFYMTTLATGLASISVEQFTIANGCGGNGKGIQHTLMMTMLGQKIDNYGYTLPMSVLCGKEMKTGANPEVANMSYKRFVIATEIDYGQQQLNAGIIKNLTSGDTEINARACFSNETNTILRASLLMECNFRPNWSSKLGQGEERRLVDYLFRSTFKDNVIADNEKFIYPKDNSLKPKIKDTNYMGIRCAFFKYLLPYFKKWIDNGYEARKLAPPSVLDRTANYIEDNDPIMSWIKDNTIEEEGQITSFKLLYERFTGDIYNLDIPKKQAKKLIIQKNFKAEIEDREWFRHHFHLRKKIKGKDYNSIFLGVRFIKSKRWGDEEDENEKENNSDSVNELDYETD